MGDDISASNLSRSFSAGTRHAGTNLSRHFVYFIGIFILIVSTLVLTASNLVQKRRKGRGVIEDKPAELYRVLQIYRRGYYINTHCKYRCMYKCQLHYKARAVAISKQKLYAKLFVTLTINNYKKRKL